jgi:RHS repeat-associated protein
MKKLHFLALILSLLIVSLPVCFSTQMTYDGNGNLQYSSYEGVNLYREYNSFNQLKFVRNGTDASAPIIEEFEFHPIEERTWVKKTYNSSGQVTETTYYLSKEFVMVVNSSGTYNYTFIYMDNQIVAQVNPDNSVFYLMGDAKGSTVVTTNSSGAVLENTTYTDFGNVISGDTKSERGYESKEYDSVTKTLDFNFRRINPAAPIWEQPDSIIQNFYDPQLLNRYMFERGNPWNRIDPTGHFFTFLIGAVIIAIVAVSVVRWIEGMDDAGDDLDKRIDVHLQAIGDLSNAVTEGIPDNLVFTDALNAKGGLDLKDQIDKLMEEDDKKKDESLSDLVDIRKKVVDENSGVVTWINEQVKSEDLPATQKSLSDSGWTYVPPDDDGGGDYYCVGTGCPGVTDS